MDRLAMCSVSLLYCFRFCSKNLLNDFSCDNIFLVRLSPIVPKALLSPLVISLLCLQLNTSILWRISFRRFFFNYLFILWDGDCWERGVLSQLFPPCISCFVFVFCVHSFWEYFSSVIFDDVVGMFLHSIHPKPLLLSWSNRRFIWFFLLCKYFIWDLPLSRNLFLFSSP